MKKLKKFFWAKFPRLTKIYGAIMNKEPNNTFKGWGMITTDNFPPWHSPLNENLFKNIKFSEIHELFLSKIENGFLLSQYNDLSKKEKLNRINELKWRHYILCWSINFVKSNDEENYNFVECGVADGMSAFYLINSLSDIKHKHIYLYDSWSKMEENNLTSNEQSNIGKYEYLRFEETKKNLKEFENYIIYNKGIIKNNFDIFNNPEKICWISIDLNSSKATLDCLNFFYKKIIKNGIIILDDYGSIGYVDTRVVVDNFFNEKKENILQLPTGQAIVIKK